MQVRISDIVAQPHLRYFNSKKLHQIDHGGRAGYKSSKNAIKIALQMLADPTCEVVIVRWNYSDHKSTTFPQMLWAFNKLGVKLQANRNYPLGNDLWIKLPQGNHVHFKQAKDLDNLKGTMPKGVDNAIKIVWFFEITQFKSEYYLNETIATFIRGVKDYIYFMYEYNDHPKLFHWTYDWIKRMMQSPDAYVNKTNYNDAPLWQQEKFLGLLMLKEIQRLKEIDPEQYKSTYLGLPANLGGSCYKLFSRDKNVKPATYDYFSVSVGVDYGANDATVFTASGFTQNASSLQIFKTYYHKNGEMGVKDINQYVDDLIRFLTEVYIRTKKLIQLYIDPANLSFIQLVERALIHNKIKFVYIEELKKRSSNPNKSSVQERIDITEVMFGAGYLTIDPSCENTIKAIEQAEYNDKGERADDGRSDIDSLDSMEYSWLAEKELIQEIVLR